MVQKRKDIKARRVWKKKIPRLRKIEEYSVASNAVEAQVRIHSGRHLSEITQVRIEFT